MSDHDLHLVDASTRLDEPDDTPARDRPDRCEYDDAYRTAEPPRVLRGEPFVPWPGDDGR